MTYGKHTELGTLTVGTAKIRADYKIVFEFDPMLQYATDKLHVIFNLAEASVVNWLECKTIVVGDIKLMDSPYSYGLALYGDNWSYNCVHSVSELSKLSQPLSNGDKITLQRTINAILDNKSVDEWAWEMRKKAVEIMAEHQSAKHDIFMKYRDTLPG
jgi:hypothetical protein